MNRDSVLTEASVSPDLIESLLTHTKTLMNHVYWFEHDLNVKPQAKHTGAAINYTDINERKDDFLAALIDTLVGWVYSKKKVKEIINERLKLSDGDEANAYGFLVRQAKSKFRINYSQGQFGELVLFNFLQFFFKAVPLLRKMRIATSIGHERFGADAIHFKVAGDTNLFVIGESKCYKSKYKFASAFSDSLDSIIKTFDSLNAELSLYTFDDFIESELETIAKKYKNGELENVRFELVCLVIYNEVNKIGGDNEREIKESIKSIIIEKCNSLDATIFDSVEPAVLKRIHYIIFPVWSLDELLDNFDWNIGAK